MQTLTINPTPLNTTGPDSILELLGLRSLMGSLDSDMDIVELIEHGLPRKCVRRLVRCQRMTPLELAGALHTTPRTLLRWLSGSQEQLLLTPSQSSQLWLLGIVFTKAITTLGSERLALDWLRKGQIGLGQRRPLELASTYMGLNEVLGLLNRIDHGVYT